jgi:hypothetical protein
VRDRILANGTVFITGKGLTSESRFPSSTNVYVLGESPLARILMDKRSGN